MRKPLKLWVDQYGSRYLARTIKEMREQIPGKVSKMYVDDKSGNTFHVGYIIGKHWFTVYTPMREPA